MDKEVQKFEEDKDAATAALISEVPDEAKVCFCLFVFVCFLLLFCFVFYT